MLLLTVYSPFLPLLPYWVCHLQSLSSYNIVCPLMGFVIFYCCFVGLSACRVCRNFFYRMRCLPSLFPYKVCFLSSGALRKGFVAVMSPIFTIVLIQFFHRNLFLLRERHIFFYNRVYLKIPSELVLTIVVSSLPVVSIQKNVDAF